MLMLGQLYMATSRVNIDHARHRKPRRCVYALKSGGTGISPPDKSPPAKRPPGKVPSGDIFYCSSSRQLNHSSFTCDRSFNVYSPALHRCLHSNHSIVFLLVSVFAVLCVVCLSSSGPSSRQQLIFVCAEFIPCSALMFMFYSYPQVCMAWVV